MSTGAKTTPIPMIPLIRQVEALIDWATYRARVERRRYRVVGIKSPTGEWYYHADVRLRT